MREKNRGGGAAALGFVALLSPFVRRYPHLSAALAGRSAFLAPLWAGAVLALALLTARAIARRTGCASLAGLLRRGLGPTASRAALGLYALWLTAYAGFLLRAGAERFITTVYPGAGPWLFVLTMALVCLPAALGPFRALTRFGALALPLLLTAPLLLLLLAVKDMDFSLLLPVTGADALPSLRAGLDMANTLCAGAYLLLRSDRGGGTRVRSIALWGAALLALMALVTAGTVALFGPDATAKLQHPFFMLVRDVTVLGAVERVEPVVATLWVLSDFAFVSALLGAAGQSAGDALGKGEKTCVAVCALAAVCAAVWAIPDKGFFEALGTRWMPLGNLLFAAAAPLLAGALAGRKRGRKAA